MLASISTQFDELPTATLAESDAFSTGCLHFDYYLHLLYGYYMLIAIRTIKGVYLMSLKAGRNLAVVNDTNAAGDLDDSDAQDQLLLFYISCPKCKKRHELKVNEYETYSQSEEKEKSGGMGYKVYHFIECKGFECDSCNKKLKFSSSVSEYPEGTIEDPAIEAFIAE